MQRTIGAFAAVLLMFTAMASGAAKLTVVTSGGGGLKDGDNLYKVGSPAADFLKGFGPPERKSNGAYDYNSDGVRCLWDKAGKITGFSVFFRDGLIWKDAFKAAPDVTLEGGITAQSTYREIVKALGEPMSKDDFDNGAKLYLNYRWGQITMENQRLVSVFVGTRQ